MTLNNLIETLRQYASSHRQLNDFGHGAIEELGASRDQVYPLMWVGVPTATYSGNAVRYPLQLILIDLMFDDRSNELEVQSDMMLIGLDTVAYLRDNPDFDFTIEGDITIDFISERYTDLVAGCVLSFTLEDPKPLDRCVIPKD